MWSFFQDFKISPNFLAVKMLDTVPFVILRSRSNMNNSLSLRSFYDQDVVKYSRGYFWCENHDDVIFDEYNEYYGFEGIM